MPALTTPASIANGPGPGWEDGVLSSLYRVAFSTPDREVGGVLVGVGATDGRPPQIQAIIPAAEGYTPGQASNFTHQTWAFVHETMARHYEGLEIVGWYVSRPGAGTELTPGDLANHHRWFTD